MTDTEQVKEIKIVLSKSGAPVQLGSEKGRPKTRYVIMDTDPYTRRYRTAEPPSSTHAWTNCPTEAKLFTTRAEAYEALLEMWAERRNAPQTDPQGERVDRVPRA